MPSGIHLLVFLTNEKLADVDGALQLAPNFSRSTQARDALRL